MRDRLIELMLNAPQLPQIKGGRTTGKKYQTFQNIADYLIENGVIAPPCKVGDTVYDFFDVRGFYDINELEVENIVVGINPSKCHIYCKSKMSGSKEIFYQDSFGKTLFFAKEKAEKVLKERRKRDDKI